MFKSTSQNSFQNPFPTEGAASVNEWWLSGGISSGDCVAAYQAKGAASLAASYSNLNSPGTFDAIVQEAPTWDDISGWIFNGSSQWLSTIIQPKNTWSMIIRFSECSGNGRFIGSYASNSDRFTVSPRYGALDSHSYQIGGPSSANFSVVSPALTSGVICLVPNQGYLDGVLSGSSFTSGTANSGYLQIGKLGSLNNWFAGKLEAMSIYNIDISAQVLALTNAMNLL